MFHGRKHDTLALISQLTAFSRTTSMAYIRHALTYTETAIRMHENDSKTQKDTSESVIDGYTLVDTTDTTIACQSKNCIKLVLKYRNQQVP